MERKLYIVRHGKSSWENEGLDDIDRPLAPRGKRNAVEMAERLASAGLVPELIYSSPAVRAYSTAKLMAGHWGLESGKLEVHRELYMAYIREIFEVIERAPAEITSLAIFGHNPSFTLFANNFFISPLNNLPTAGVAVITLDCKSWADVSGEKVITAHVDYPKNTAGLIRS